MLPQLRAKRLAIALTALVLFICCVTIGRKLYNFANLFGLFKPHSGIRITQGEIAQAHANATPDPRKPVVSKILHQIFHNWKDPHNDTLPDHWAAARQTCKDLNPTWEHKLWTMENSREFLKEHFAWYLPTYDSYKFPIQRVDVLRYFLIRHYGGIYLDLDNGCAADLTPLTYYPAFTTDGGEGALSNNIMGGAPEHPYFRLLTEHLIPWNWNWLLPYVIISYSSGQWFVTAMWEKYHALLNRDGSIMPFDGNDFAPLHHILMDMREGADPWVFFTQVHGGTWTNWDSAMFSFIGDHILLIIVGVLGLVGTSVWSCMWCMRRRSKPAKGYDVLPSAEQMSEESHFRNI
ncbi:mannosyl phosphorylinositol ceramide synthase protein [Apiospora aurea]|uniref:Mannosyl phosphorylinositol ceramide synthase protein n=1 Tax=Apiospora aurea TaxID=335848 RepID=A0ABR1QT02_9PEZI